MTIFLTIIGTISVMLLVMNFLVSVGNSTSIGNLNLGMVKYVTILERMAVDQINSIKTIDNQSKVIHQLSHSLNMFTNDMDMEGPHTVIQTPHGNVSARNVDEAIDKLRAKGVSLTDDDIQELRMLFDEGEEIPPSTE